MRKPAVGKGRYDEPPVEKDPIDKHPIIQGRKSKRGRKRHSARR